MVVEKIKDQDFETYKSSEGISASVIKDFMVSPLYWKESKGVEEKDTKPKTIGSALHCFILEPHLYSQKFVVLPKLDLRTNKGKELFAELKTNYPNALFINEEESELIKRMSDSFFKNKEAVQLLENAEKEVDYYSVDEKTGLKIKGRIDINPTYNVVADIKTCEDSSEKKFLYDLMKRNMHIQASHYLSLTKKDNFIFIAMEKKIPYTVSLFAIDESFINQANQERRMLLDLIKWTFDNDYYCNYYEWELLKSLYKSDELHLFFDKKEKSRGISFLEMPSWYKY